MRSAGAAREVQTLTTTAGCTATTVGKPGPMKAPTPDEPPPGLRADFPVVKRWWARFCPDRRQGATLQAGVVSVSAGDPSRGIPKSRVPQHPPNVVQSMQGQFARRPGRGKFAFRFTFINGGRGKLTFRFTFSNHPRARLTFRFAFSNTPREQTRCQVNFSLRWTWHRAYRGKFSSTPPGGGHS